MPPSNIVLTKDDFIRSRWQEVINECAGKECQSYSTAFSTKEREASESGDLQSQEVFALLSAITSFSMDSGSRDEPFSPALVFQNSRSASPDDISDAQWDVLREVVTEAQDAEIRARMADVLWVRRRDFRMAELAIKSYLASAEVFKSSKSWMPQAERLERAVSLAASLGRAAPRFTEVIAHVESAVDEAGGDDPRLFSARLMELLQKYEQGDPSKYAKMAETAALRAEAEHDWSRARAYWEVKAGWHALGGDADKRRDALISVAETYVKDAEDFSSQTPPSYISASAQIQRAVVALRRIEGTNERVDSLHRLLLEFEERANAEMKTFSRPIDFSPYIESAREQIRGKSFPEALLNLAFMFPHPSVAELRKQVLDNVEDYRFRDMLCVVEVINERGKVIGRKPSFASGDPEEVERAIRAEMFDHAKRFQWMYANAFIEPARHQINLEHRNISVRDFLSAVTNTPFVPQGREDIYAYGLCAGLRGDFMVCVHTLVPQLENSLRHVLEQRNLVVSGLDQGGIQKEYDLNKLVETYPSQIESVFSEDLVFDFRGLLIERFGSNLRNRLAHGLITYQEFFSPSMVYLWWLTLRLCLLPTARTTSEL